VAGGDQEDEGGDRQTYRQGPDHRVGGPARPPPTAVIGL
jgi:hypothetical protein